jgi:integrase
MPDYHSFISMPCMVRSRKAFKLFTSNTTGDLIEYNIFSRYCFWLAEGGRKNGTFKRYILAVPKWLDYMCVAMKLYGDKISTYSLYLSYADYLSNGSQSGDPVVQRMVAILGEDLIGRKSLAVTHSAMDSFITFCAEECAKSVDYANNGLSIGQEDSSRLVTDMALIAQQAQRRIHSGSKRHPQSRRTNKISEHVANPSSDKFKPIAPDKYFPLGHIAEFIGNLQNPRDAALMSLCAASSWRVSESLQLLWEDIDFASRKIYCYEPVGRRNFLQAYAGLKSYEREQLAWKGRETSETVLLEPYGSLFFKNLNLYRTNQSSSQHNFVFETEGGRPLFLSSYSRVVLDAFKTAATPIYEKLGLSLRGVGVHSLRHSYCYFMYNFIEFEDGMGMSLNDLAKLTGHKDINSLEIYAQRDRERFYEEIYIATQSRVNGGDVTENQLRFNYLRNRLAEVAKILDDEKGASNG